MLHKNIGRIEAGRDMRQVNLLVRTQSAEGLEELVPALREEIGQTIVVNEGAVVMAQAEEERDRVGLLELKSMGGKVK